MSHKNTNTINVWDAFWKKKYSHLPNGFESGRNLFKINYSISSLILVVVQNEGFYFQCFIHKYQPYLE